MNASISGRLVLFLLKNSATNEASVVMTSLYLHNKSKKPTSSSVENLKFEQQQERRCETKLQTTNEIQVEAPKVLRAKHTVTLEKQNFLSGHMVAQTGWRPKVGRPGPMEKP